jgi:hypothetical protein
MNTKSRTILDKTSFQLKNTLTKTKTKSLPPPSDVEAENILFTHQLQELAREFSSSDNYYIRQHIINVAKEIIKRSNDILKVEKYIQEILS